MITKNPEPTRKQSRDRFYGREWNPGVYTADSLDDVITHVQMDCDDILAHPRKLHGSEHKENPNNVGLYSISTNNIGDYSYGYCKISDELYECFEELSVLGPHSSEVLIELILRDNGTLDVYMKYQYILGSRKAVYVKSQESEMLDKLKGFNDIRAGRLDGQRKKAKENTRKAFQSIQDSIAKMNVNGNRIELPDEYLDNYQDVARVLKDAGGKYKKNGFEFKTDAQTIYDRLMSGEKVNDKQKFQFFETQPEQVNRLHELADIQTDDLILEPSAGYGALVKEFNLTNEVHVMELNSECRETLEQSGFNLVGEPDFLANEPTEKYDKILANPPFTKNQDIKHIKHMYKFLKPGGRIVTIASTSWQQGNQKLQKEFRKWLKELDAHIEQVEAGAFKKSGTTVATTIIVIDKEI